MLAIGEDITDLIETSRKHKERLDTMALENKLLKRKIDLVRRGNGPRLLRCTDPSPPSFGPALMAMQLEQQLTYAKFRADNKEGQ